MAYSYPMWFHVVSDSYKTGKSFGGRDFTTIDVRVGTSSNFSTPLGEITVRRKDVSGEKGDYVFQLYLDGKLVKEMVVDVTRKEVLRLTKFH